MDAATGAAMDPGALVRIGLPLVNASIMLGVGMALAAADFRRVVAAPRALLAGLAGHYLVLPLLGFAVAAAFAAEYELAVGFVLVSACPSAAASNALTYLARGNLALAVLLTAASALLSVLTLPLLVGAALHVFAGASTRIELPLSHTIGHLLVLVALPVLAGMAARRAWPRACATAEPWLNRIGLAGLLGLVVVIMVQQQALLLHWLPRLALATTVLCVLALCAGYLLGRTVRAGHRDALTLGLEVGVQNCMLALLIAYNVLGAHRIGMPAAIYGVLMYPLAFAFIRVGRAVARRDAAGADA